MEDPLPLLRLAYFEQSCRWPTLIKRERGKEKSRLRQPSSVLTQHTRTVAADVVVCLCCLYFSPPLANHHSQLHWRHTRRKRRGWSLGIACLAGTPPLARLDLPSKWQSTPLGISTAPPSSTYDDVGFRKKNGCLGTALPNSFAWSA